MGFFRQILLLMVTTGILVCPYTCMGGFCADSMPGIRKANGCRCQKCRHEEQEAPTVPVDQEPASDGGHFCVCVCDGAITRTADEDLIPVVSDLAFGSAVPVGCETAQVSLSYRKFYCDRPPHASFESGRAVRIRIQSFLI